MLATSLGPLDVALGEILYALLRGVVYAAGFLTVMQVMGLTLSWTAALTLPEGRETIGWGDFFLGPLETSVHGPAVVLDADQDVGDLVVTHALELLGRHEDRGVRDVGAAGRQPDDAEGGAEHGH